MKEKIKRWLMLLMVVMGVLLSTTMTAFAYTNEGEQRTEADTPVIEEETWVAGETPAEIAGTPFSISGNGQLLDDKTEDGTKQFLTIRTKNGNTFFMILDRSSNTENVYMLSLVDEDDLAEFLDEPREETPALVIPEAEATHTELGTETKAEPEKEDKGGMNVGALLAVAVLLLGGIGGYYYFKVLKPRKDDEDEDGEDLEFYDGGAYVNEDQAASDDGEDEE